MNSFWARAACSATRCTVRRIPFRQLPRARWSSTGGRQWSTPLAKSLAEAITTTGPIPVAAYMRQCLTSPDGGYYTSRTQGRDQFGQKGDFVTSPEISQIFGELIGIWIVAEWISQGSKSSGVYIMEVGPGRGTLMDDALRTIRKFPPLAAAIESIYLVEASPALRHAQKQLLCGDAPMKETDVGFESTSKHSSELKVTWSEDIRFIPKDASKTPFIIAHEFFDALPIHIFQSVPPAASDSTITTSAATAPSLSPPTRRKQEPQWRELMVSPTPAPNRFLATEKELESAKDQPDFQLALAKASTPHSLYLPELSQRYKALKSIPDSIIEISPESQSYAADFATRIGGGNSKPPASPAGSYQEPSQPHSTRTVASPNTQSTLHKPQPSGAALILDYGPTSTIPTNSLRGIRAHKLCSPFSEPGKTDISADVDFVALAEAAINASPGVEVHGPVEQGVWLHAMGGLERVGQLVKAAMGKASGRERDEVAGEDGDEGAGAGGDDSKGRKMKDGLREEVERIEAGWRRLVDRGPQGMGRIYKVMAMVPYVEVKEGEVRRRPVGFGGDVKV